MEEGIVNARRLSGLSVDFSRVYYGIHDGLVGPGVNASTYSLGDCSLNKL